MSGVPAQPTLRDGDVSLRPRTHDDAEAAGVQHDDYAAERRIVAFVVENRGEVAGTVDVKQRGDGVGELSWSVYPHHRGQGVGRRAVRLLVDYCFTDLGLVRVEAAVEAGNTASIRTAGRAGLRREGVSRRFEPTGDRRPDYVRMARLVTDPAPDTRDGFLGVLNAGLPTKRVIAQGLLRNRAGKVLLCELTYKREWDLPGGVVDPGESPAAAVRREVTEELGIEPEVGRLRVVDWMPPWRAWDDACLFVFDLGVHDEAIVDRMVFEAREIAAVHWCTPAEAEPHIPDYAKTLLKRLVEGPPETTYLENGHPM